MVEALVGARVVGARVVVCPRGILSLDIFACLSICMYIFACVCMWIVVYADADSVWR